MYRRTATRRERPKSPPRESPKVLAAASLCEPRSRVVEPYSVRISAAGNRNLYAHELTRGGKNTGHIKAFHVPEIRSPEVLATPFTPRWRVEL